MEMKFKRRKTYPMDDHCKLLAGVDVGRNLRVDFLKLAPSRDFETSSRAVKKLQGATLTDPVLTCMHSIPDRLSTFCVGFFFCYGCTWSVGLSLTRITKTKHSV